MRLSKDKTSLIYNQFLTLSEIPKEPYDYRLGNRSAQYSIAHLTPRFQKIGGAYRTSWLLRQQ
jgi:predicted helicase